MHLRCTYEPRSSQKFCTTSLRKWYHYAMDPGLPHFCIIIWVLTACNLVQCNTNEHFKDQYLLCNKKFSALLVRTSRAATFWPPNDTSSCMCVLIQRAIFTSMTLLTYLYIMGFILHEKFKAVCFLGMSLIKSYLFVSLIFFRSCMWLHSWHLCHNHVCNQDTHSGPDVQDQ